MATEIVDLPLAVIDDIVSRMDLLTIPCLKATCPFMNNQITTECYNKLVAKKVKQKISGIINTVKDYHQALLKEDVDDKFFKIILKKLYTARRYFMCKSVYWCVHELLKKIKKETNFRFERIQETWDKPINQTPLTQDDNIILDCMKRLVIGTQSIYIVSFNYINKYTKNKSFYCVMNIEFDNNGDIKLAVSIQDVDPYRKIFETTIEEQIMDIVVNDKTLTELSEFMVNVSGAQLSLSKIEIVNNIEKWNGEFTKYGELIYDSALHTLVNPLRYRNEIKSILA